MNNSTVKKETGRSLEEWFQIIQAAGHEAATHKQIAIFLQQKQGVTDWWAQGITVEFEKSIGRRVLGQTNDGLFQIGVSKTIPAPAETVWHWLESTSGIAQIIDQNAKELVSLDTNTGSIRATTTTFKSGSHLRMQWRLAEWPAHSILQIRVTPKSDSKSVLSFHQEKLPSEDAREQMRLRWQRVVRGMAKDLAVE